MVLVSPNLALLVFAIILVAAAALSLKYYDYARFDKSAFHSFVIILGGLGVFVTFMFYYNVVQLQNQEQEIAALQELSRINDSMENGLLVSLRESSLIIPSFVLSLTPLANTVCCDGATPCTIPTTPDPVTPHACTAKTTLSHRIFSIWQDIILSGKFINYDSSSYLTAFLQWCNSKPLAQQWRVARIGFNSRVQEFGDLLFLYGLPITIQTPEEYVRVTQELLADPRYQEIMSS